MNGGQVAGEVIDGILDVWGLVNDSIEISQNGQDDPPPPPPPRTPPRNPPRSAPPVPSGTGSTSSGRELAIAGGVAFAVIAGALMLSRR